MLRIFRNFAETEADLIIVLEPQSCWSVLPLFTPFWQGCSFFIGGQAAGGPCNWRSLRWQISSFWLISAWFISAFPSPRWLTSSSVLGWGARIDRPFAACF